jgi:ribosome-associated translation inhibitor RaiA
MQYQITSDNIQMSSSMETLAKSKVGKIENQLKNVPEDSRLIRVVMNTIPDNMFEVKLLITVRGKEYFTDEKDFTFRNCFS